MARQTSVTEADLEFMLIDENAKPKPLPYSLLEKITNGFSGAHIIGYGGSADVYEGFIGNHKIAVKRLRIPYQHEKEFSQEIECLMKVKHINVVRFIGYCSDTQGQAEKYEDNHVMADSQERLICFEFLPACLDKYIKDPSCSLEWRQRYQIINGVCQGLHQLHEHEILHLDLNPRNILLDDDMVPKISDFGISKCLKKNQGHFYTETISGTPIYMSPERGKHGPITTKSDLFSLGVTVIEIMTGNKENIDQATVEDVYAWDLGTQLLLGPTRYLLAASKFSMINH
uniref:non-specific serine/threonine protein kinase n=1 Tax=Zea mays TaxID=4577 RepID=C0PMF3_MAIZE|nr:unknown [Zea mays]